MTTATHLCPHGVNMYAESCGRCESDRKRYADAKAAYEPLSRNINSGSTGILGAVVGREHAYLLNELATAVARGVLVKTYDSLCNEPGTIFKDVKHPAHDGRIGCGTVIGALSTLAMRPGEDGLAERKFWLDRNYDAGY